MADYAAYITFLPHVLAGVFGFIVLMNIKENINLLKLKFQPNSCILRFKTPARKEEEVVVNLNDTVYRRKGGSKNFAYIIDSTKMFFKSPTLNSFKQVFQDKDEKAPKIDDVLKAQFSHVNFKGKTPVLEFRTDNAEPIDPFKQDTLLSAELLEGMLVGAEATSNTDFFQKLMGYRNIWQIAGAIAIASLAAAFLSWQIMNHLNTIQLCQIAADQAAVIVAK